MKKCVLTALLLTCGMCCGLHAAEPPAPCGPVPTDDQVKWLRMEWYAFVHFGLNTYTNREWGYGNESPALFNPARFHAGNIVQTFREAGMNGMIYTAKHHDGWCAWPTETTPHNISASPWRDGKGDVVGEFAAACKQQGMPFGVYISPWDRNCADYGRSEYLTTYYTQVEELLTRYGSVFEIWFDGANGGDGFYGGAREHRNIGNATQYYDFPRLVQTIRTLQPRCIIWGAVELGDVEWGGSEKGFVPYPCNNIRLVHGQQRWVSLEGDTPINKSGWFWHPGQEKTVKSPSHLMQVYLDSVGRGANLILNIAPNREGELDAADVASLLEFGRLRRELLARDYALGARAEASEVRGNDPQFAADKLTDDDVESYWCPEDESTTGHVTISLPAPQTFDVIRLREQIRLGQRIEAFELDAFVDNQWKTVDSGGRSIGNQVMRKLNAPITTDRVRVRVTAAKACPCLSELSLLRMPQIDHPRQAQQKDTGLSKEGWQSDDNALMAIDGKSDTLWTASGQHSFFGVDMKALHRISAFSCLPRQDGKLDGIVDRYAFFVSTDGKTWQRVAEGEFSNMRANPIEQRIDFEPVEARYWRFSVERTLEGCATVAEINIYPEQ